ncbi:glycosyltransferase family 2 protein [Ruicaihuangia caeni]|uniref:Glycosyltransferase family 2 protein n=1 Tax=Ruicaihuangia caeni TaxID=3042517 RepID=A0AAW6T7E8_9MICO|nr:glycosyltransferase family 2 protein [Klugiella sp. YN-L-19]MDI2097557.1 glycosyltransferase family 2 protein [Klugiella sp. YN-L-19]
MADDRFPGVSYVIPVLNEAGYIEHAVRTVLAQDYPGERELILALGPSTDGTDEIVERLAERDPRVRWVRNPQTDIPAGLNLAIRASRHPIVVRVDAHSELEPDYTRKAVAVLQRTGAANVGGLMKAQGRTPFQAAVARAYNSRIGLGGGQYHGGTDAGPAESAYLGVFRREVLFEAGLYDESVRRGEDWELNLRIRSAGHLVWFDPDLEVTYWPRDSWEKLVRQFSATGAWRGELVRRYKGRNPLRFFVPPLLVLAIVLSLVLAVLQLTGVVHGWPSWLLSAVYLGPLAYLALLLWVSFVSERGATARDRWLYLLVLPSMHLAWGAGFIVGVLKGARDVVDTSRTG